jgi:hypothetical protein
VHIKKGFKQFLAEANAEIRTLTSTDAISLDGSDDVVFVDLRDSRELEHEGKMPGALPCTCGMLEFWIDPESPYHKSVFAEDKRFVFFCVVGLAFGVGGEDRTGHVAGERRAIEGGFGA